MLWDINDHQVKRLPPGSADIFYSYHRRLSSKTKSRLTEILDQQIRKVRIYYRTTQFSRTLKDEGLFDEVLQAASSCYSLAYKFCDLFVRVHLSQQPGSDWFLPYDWNRWDDQTEKKFVGLLFLRCRILKGRVKRLKGGKLPIHHQLTPLTAEQIAAIGAYPNYSAYIQSDGWKIRRAPVLDRASGNCERCGRRARLDVHHLHYLSLGCERPSDLEALCPECHEQADEERVSPDEIYDRIYTELLRHRGTS